MTRSSRGGPASGLPSTSAGSASASCRAATHSSRRGSEIEPTTVLDCAIELKTGAGDGERVQIHHGTRTAAGRAVELGDGLWQIRLEAPILAAAGDRLVVRSVAPPDTLGGGVILDPAARRHGRRSPAVERLERLRRGEPEPEPQTSAESAASDEDPPTPQDISPAAATLEIRLRESGHHPEPVTALAGLSRRTGRAAVGRDRGSRRPGHVRPPRCRRRRRPEGGRDHRGRGLDHPVEAPRRARNLAEVRPGLARASRRQPGDETAARQPPGAPPPLRPRLDHRPAKSADRRRADGCMPIGSRAR